MRFYSEIICGLLRLTACATALIAPNASAQEPGDVAASSGEHAESDDYLSSLRRESEARQAEADGPLRFLDDWTIFTGIEFGLDVGSLGARRDLARRGRYGDSGLAVNILPVRARFFRLLNLELMFGYVRMNDYDPIMNEVVCVMNCTSDDEPFVAESEVGGLTLSAATGLATPPFALGPLGFTLGCNFGVQAAWPHREIDRCIDCDEEELVNLSGTYLEPTMLLGWAERLGSGESGILGVRASYRAFLGDSELRYAWTLGFAIALYLESN